MASIRFYLKAQKNGTAQIMAAFQNGSECPTRYLGYNISAAKTGTEYKYWNKNSARVRSLDQKKLAEINKKINDWQTKFDNYISECNIDNTAPDIANFIKTLDGTFKSKTEKNTITETSLLSLITQFLKSIKTTHGTLTYNAYKVLKGNIEKYQEKRKTQILLSGIDLTFYKDFSHYLITEHLNTNGTITRKQKQIHAILSYAVNDLKLITVNPDYKKIYKLKTAQAPKFPLFPEELATLRAWHTNNQYHRMVLDSFLLACETGLRYSDIVQLQPAHIQSHISAAGMIKFIALTNIKTDNKNNMPLSDHAIKIVDKYLSESTTDIMPEKHFVKGERRGLKGVVKNGIGFRFDHSQPVGRLLKEILKDAKLTRPVEIIKMQGAKTTREIKPLHDIISFHMARNTYITRLLSSNLAPAFVKDNAGHSDLKVTMGYFRNDDVTRWQETLKILNN